MTDTPNLNLPYLLAAQSQKHVTHNEALRTLDSVVQLSVLDRDLTAPPASPAEGDRYIVAASPSGAWSGQTDNVAAFQGGAWLFYQPKEGWMAWVADENALVVFDGAGWALAARLTTDCLLGSPTMITRNTTTMRAETHATRRLHQRRSA
jgi:hypothetical protein